MPGTFLWIAFHTIFSLTLMQGSSLLAADWWTALDRPWGLSALEDQQIGGGIAWGYGDLPILVIIVVLGLQWIRADRREASRFDRAVDRGPLPRTGRRTTPPRPTTPISANSTKPIWTGPELLTVPRGRSVLVAI